MEVLDSPNSSIDQSIWSNENTCIQAPSYDRLAAMSSVLLGRLMLRNKNSGSIEKTISKLKDYLSKFDEDNDERAEVLLLLGQIYDRNMHDPESAVENHFKALELRPKNECAQVSIKSFMNL